MELTQEKELLIFLLRMQYFRTANSSVDEKVVAADIPKIQELKKYQDLLGTSYSFTQLPLESPPILASEFTASLEKASGNGKNAPRNLKNGSQSNSNFEDSDYAVTDFSEFSDMVDDENSCMFSFTKVPMRTNARSGNEVYLNHAQKGTRKDLESRLPNGKAFKSNMNNHSRSISRFSSLSSEYERVLNSSSDDSLQISDGEIGIYPYQNSPKNDEEVGEFRSFEKSQEQVEDGISKRVPTVVKQPESALRKLFENENSTSQQNPLADSFAGFSGHAEPNPLKLKIYCPFSENASQPMYVELRNTILVSEAIGYILFRYISQNMMPVIEDEAQNPNYWNLRIVEDDGELDDDFPALDRTGPLAKFTFDAFALVKATNAQIKENQAAFPFVTKKKKITSVSDDDHFHTHHTSSTSNNSNKVGESDKDIFNSMHIVKIRLYPYGESSRFCNVEVSKNTRFAMVLNQVCWMKQLERLKYTLRIADSDVTLPLDKTFQSIDGFPTLELVKKKMRDKKGPSLPVSTPSPEDSTYNSTKKDYFPPAYNAADIMSSNTYQEFIVWKRQPVSFMGRHERLLAIDGEYIHIMPSESRNIFETPKTTSIHVGSIVICKQSKKSPCNFKLIISRNRETKRYDFEVLSSLEAAVIVSRIRTLMSAVAKNY
ncbi:stress activated MAP kinase interacting protein Sin1 [Schizosaccharomyces cryophilus OY26]|uniref:Stress activated MAP kinase interacting protein Sin1 n=1 Tax=Schizosaccharomyces cryophilus (strain OY26 / ATCC MYA-4695 / CBS 11777 / NBRC 106824 / NRRL Y48691) TaxID=653667 RepID=S9X9E9_SCHCR|nr:stress activated MAP kinase interacting protein Sin1 [Schizosaccharomyces cryophilus OY26]EPY50326.1 stress activated MAP kinase interacting protein Sin1 [Schizosaccharomyces cryophilus OY26]